nr:MAG TPA: hypothetical protein [Caudoviricetes sp.]
MESCPDVRFHADEEWYSLFQDCDVRLLSPLNPMWKASVWREEQSRK